MNQPRRTFLQTAAASPLLTLVGSARGLDMQAQVLTREAWLTAFLLSHSWAWNPDVPGNHDHGYQGTLPFELVGTTGNIQVSRTLIAQEPIIVGGFPRVENRLTLDRTAVAQIFNQRNGIVNRTGRAIVATGPESPGQATGNEAIFRTFCARIPAWDLNFGIGASRGHDQCIDGIHVKGNAVEIALFFPRGVMNPTEDVTVPLARLRMEVDNVALVEHLHPSATLHQNDRFAATNAFRQGDRITFDPLGFPGQFPTYYVSGLLTLAINASSPLSMTPAFVQVTVSKGQHAGNTYFFFDSVLGMLTNQAGENHGVEERGFFSRTYSRFFSGGVIYS
ncbi:MAG TPA: hypothetical protein VEA59_07330 [Patescibacteria group bacterium]|nr:hypothetical protein [Patescibacteria group bacterium]